MLLTLYNACTKKTQVVKRYIEDQKTLFLEKVYRLENPFYLAFYEQSVESIVADGYEFFVELECEYNYFYENLWKLTNRRGQRFFKMMSMYHTIKILRKKRDKLRCEEMKQVLFSVFSFNETEKRLYELLYHCACQYEGEFQNLFNKALAKYIFGDDINNPFTLAFIQNFCYNSYNSFMRSFTRYVSLGRRLKGVGNGSFHVKEA